MTNLKWGPPPPVKTKPIGPSAETQAILRKLKARPGEWALVQQNAATSSVAKWKRVGLKTTIRKSSSVGRYNIYAMWPKEGINEGA